VGINAFIVSPSGANDGVGFAVPSNIARVAYEQIRKQGRVTRGQIGVVAQAITPSLAQALSLAQLWGGEMIADVAPKSAAEAAGIEVKDVILSFEGKPMENARQFGVNIYQHAGDIVSLEVLRNGRKVTPSGCPLWSVPVTRTASSLLCAGKTTSSPNLASLVWT